MLLVTRMSDAIRLEKIGLWDESINVIENVKFLRRFYVIENTFLSKKY